MFPLILAVALSLAAAQTPPANPACALLTPAQVSSLIGAAKTIPISMTSTGSSCMMQAGEKIITVLIATVTPAEGATQLFETKKRIVSGADVPGWGVPAYAGTQRPSAAVVGIVKGGTFTEAKLIDPPQVPDALGVKLKAVMKEVAGRK